MAYARSIKQQCAESGCTSTAVAEVITNRNERTSAYCSRHVNRALRKRQALEDRWAAEERARAQRSDPE